MSKPSVLRLISTISGTNLAVQQSMTMIYTSAIKKIGIPIIFAAIVSVARASTITAASAAYADVLAAVNSAVRGDTVNVPAGSATWNQTLTITKGVALVGAGRDSTFITSNGPCIAVNPDNTTIQNEDVIRVAGFTLDGNNAALSIINVQGAYSNGNKPFKGLAIGNNRFRNARPQTSGSGAIVSRGQVRGAIYGNIFDRMNVLLKLLGNNDSGQEWVNPAYVPFAYGSPDNLFFENNTIQWSSPNRVDGSNGWIESGQGGRVVVRYNTWNMTNADNYDNLWDIHGFQNWPGNGQTGSMIVEYYGNTVTNGIFSKLVAHRGSWGLFHNNIVQTTGPASIAMTQYSPDGVNGPTSGIPFFGGTYTSEVNNTYVWNNTNNGNSITAWFLNGRSDGSAQVIFENVNWWNFNASFNGNSGMGRGTATPTGSCTVGVAYWKNATPTVSVDPAVVQAGRLYKCLRENVWTEYYAPYTYPHPLVSGIGSTTGAPAVVSGATSGAVGEAFRYQIGASNGPTSYGASGLPSGLTLDSSNGVITGTPLTSGNYSVGVNASNASGSGSAIVAIAITPSAPIGAGVTPALFDASKGVISAPFVVNGSDIAQSALTDEPSLGGRAVYTFNVTSPGTYAVAAEVNAVDESSNSLFVNMDAEPTASGMIWSIPPTSGFQSRPVTWGFGTLPQFWSLNAGTHRLIIRGREANTVLRSVSIIQRPGAPVGVVQTK